MSDITYLTCESTSGTSYLTGSTTQETLLRALSRHTNNTSRTSGTTITNLTSSSFRTQQIYGGVIKLSWTNYSGAGITGYTYSNGQSLTRTANPSIYKISANRQYTTFTSSGASQLMTVSFNAVANSTGWSVAWTSSETNPSGGGAYYTFSTGTDILNSETTSITGTSYLTRESTSGYSGVLSSTYTENAALKLINKVNDSTYRAMYYTSESGSTYTTAEQSEEMYDTTVLTREYTTGTSYLTGSVSNQMKMLSIQTSINTYTNSYLNGGQSIYRSSLNTYTVFESTHILNSSSASLNSSRTRFYYTLSAIATVRRFSASAYSTKTIPYTTSRSSMSTSTSSAANQISTMNIGTTKSSYLDYNSTLTSSTKYEKYSYNTTYWYSSNSENMSVIVMSSSSTNNAGYSSLVKITRTISMDLRSTIESITGTSYLTSSSTYGYSGKTNTSHGEYI